MKFQYLLIGTSLSLIPQTINAQCVATQDCATLGYTETSCSGGSGVKCPFGNKWACFKSESEIKNQLCTDLGFTLTCTGTGYSGGGSLACNGKYNYCSCTSGYTWNATNKICEYDYNTNCTIGALYYSDGTCSQDKLSSKTLLGVVIYEKSASESGWIITVSPIQTGIMWGGYGTDIPRLTNITSQSDLIDIQASCINTDIITAYGDSSKYPAAWAAKNYKPTGTPSSKSWCLPSGGLLYTALYNNSPKLAKVNAGITTAGGSILGDGYSSWENIWSSSEYSDYKVWVFRSSMGSWLYMQYYDKNDYDNYYSVRPVLPF